MRLFENHFAVRAGRYGGPPAATRSAMFSRIGQLEASGMATEDAVIQAIRENPSWKAFLHGHWREVVERAGV